MSSVKCACGCGSSASTKEYTVAPEGELSLSDLPVGAAATILRITPEVRGRKKFTDIGMIPGAELVMEAHAPFGGLLRVKVMDTSMAIHRDDARGIILKKRDAEK